ncbi:LysR family transcriptional regulator [Roseateles cellulosilyticus]|uniref:LysR family transcriptional regulator n=1 Tax=Pelomonas cellulosilytica TaxID=2906762 RepID=A0ABS8XV71_9BURK|nr:LysR family transcriptional regulator [Pelomonas sp. P8]MCE4556584.1 LysR family transcriptional regulator [Pelomonas sp. P8]
MNLSQIEAFVHVAEHGSFSKAALVLGVAQPLLSRQVRALEVDLRETLLERHGRGVRLTEAGRRLLEHGQDILQLVQHAREDLRAQRDEPAGSITLAVPPTQARLLTLPLIQAFQARWPAARLAIMEGFSTTLTEWLLTGRCDLALVYNPEPLPALEIVPLRREALCLYSAVAQAPTGPLTLQRLAQLPLVMPQRGQLFRSRLESAAAMAGMQLDVRWEVSSVPALLDLVAAGVGHAALGEDALHSYERRERLAVSRFDTEDLHCTLCLVTPANRRPTPLQRGLASLLLEHFRMPRDGAVQAPTTA